MKPLVLFDYVYYSIAYLYANKLDHEEQKELAGVLGLSLFQLINTVTLFEFFYIPLKRFEKFDPVIIYILGWCLFIALNFVRYKKFINYSQLLDKWGKERGITRLIKIVCVVCYFILSIHLSAYFGNAHR